MTGDELLRHIVRRLRGTPQVPSFDFVVEHPDAELLAAWRAPVVTNGSGGYGTTAETMFDLAALYANPDRVMRVLVAQVERSLERAEHATRWRRMLDACRAEEDVRAATFFDADELVEESKRAGLYADMRVGIAVRGFLRPWAPEPSHILFNAGYGYAHGHGGAKTYALQFARRAADALREAVPPPTWAQLLAGR